MTESRIHIASRVILSSPRAIFRAFLDAESVASWRPPKGMTAQIFSFDPRVGGGYRMAFHYPPTEQGRGKSTDDADICEGRFLEILPDTKIVEAVVFEANDPSFSGTMTITTSLTPVADGTKVSIRAENVPSGISEADHRAGMESTLKNLANFLE
ncbi:SRPBCC family protein [soil metagenome]